MSRWLCLVIALSFSPLSRDGGGLAAQPVCGYPDNPYRSKAEYDRCEDSVAKADPYAALIPTDPLEAALNRRKEKARQDSVAKADPYADLTDADPFDVELRRREEKARQDSIAKVAYERDVPKRLSGETVEQYLARTGPESDPWLVAYEEKEAELRRERLGRWLWAVPLLVLALVVLVAVWGEPVKAWIGRLHGGQVFILASGLLAVGFLFLVVALFIDSIPTAWLTGFIPVGVLSAVLVLWFWFGARAKPKGDV